MGVGSSRQQVPHSDEVVLSAGILTSASVYQMHDCSNGLATDLSGRNRSLQLAKEREGGYMSHKWVTVVLCWRFKDNSPGRDNGYNGYNGYNGHDWALCMPIVAGNFAAPGQWGTKVLGQFCLWPAYRALSLSLDLRIDLWTATRAWCWFVDLAACFQTASRTRSSCGTVSRIRCVCMLACIRALHQDMWGKAVIEETRPCFFFARFFRPALVDIVFFRVDFLNLYPLGAVESHGAPHRLCCHQHPCCA